MKTNNGQLVVTRMLLLDRQQSTDKDKVLVRVLFVDDFDSTVWLCRVDDDDSWPFLMTKSELDAAMDPEHGRYVVELDDPWVVPGAVKQNAKAIELQRQRFELIKPLISGENERLILFKQQRKLLIRKRLKEVKCSHETMTILLRRYWKRGMTYDALRPDFDKCGIIKKEGDVRKVSADVKLGAPRKKTPGRGINIIGDYLKKALQHGADYWVSMKKWTLKDAYDQMTRIFFSEPIKIEGNKIIGFKVDHDNKPTIRQLQYFIHKNYPEGKIRRRRHGQKNWDLKERALLGTADGDVQGPGDRYQIDATVADVYLVSQFDRRRIVGRPVIYFIIDVFSRMIVGIYVGFEGPSWPGAMMALTNMVTPKVEFCKQYDIEIEEAEWPSHHAPRRIMGDRGEMMSVDLGKNIVEKLRIDIENASPGRADLKALVERRFGIVPAKFRPFTPGYVQKDFNQRGAEDYRLKASLTLYEFTQMVIFAVLEHNAEPIRGINLPAEMITDGLAACPIDLWEWGISNRSGSLKLLSIDEVCLNVMPSDTARVTLKGIHFNGGYYSSPAALRDDWFSKARRQSWTIDVSYDPRNMGILYIRDANLDKGYEACKLLPQSTDRMEKSLFEVMELDIDQKRIEANGENKRQEKRLFRDKRMGEIQSKAKKATKAVSDPEVSKAAKVAFIGQNKADEKLHQRSVESFNLAGDGCANVADGSSTNANSDSAVNDYRSRELARLETKRKLREGK